jgi:hypothetical protein
MEHEEYKPKRELGNEEDEALPETLLNHLLYEEREGLHESYLYHPRHCDHGV